MLRNTKTLEGSELRGRDGEVGRIKDIYFDSALWHLRYFVVDTGSWLTGRTVLIAPSSLTAREWDSGTLTANLTKEQVRNSPAVDTAKPVSRQNETELHNYYAWPYYWGAPAMSGMYVPAIAPAAAAASAEPAAFGANRSSMGTATDGDREEDSHLRSARAIRGYHIAASDRSIGHIEDVVVDDESWAVSYLVVDTRNWWPGKKVVLSLSQVRGLSWLEKKIYVDATSEEIKESPEFDSERPLAADYVDRLEAHYRKGAS